MTFLDHVLESLEIMFCQPKPADEYASSYKQAADQTLARLLDVTEGCGTESLILGRVKKLTVKVTTILDSRYTPVDSMFIPCRFLVTGVFC